MPLKKFAADFFCTRGELDAALQDFVGTGTDYKTLRGLIKLLIDECVFETRSPLAPEEIRRQLFLHARSHHPVVTRDDAPRARAELIEEVAQQLACAPADIEEGLYADLAGNQRLIEFTEQTPAQLLARYNLAQAQALLYRAVEMQLFVRPQAPAQTRQLFNAIKAYRLIHSIDGDAQRGYEVRLTGPVSMFHRSQKYGIQMAVFLPALLQCKGWQMRVEIAAKDKPNAHANAAKRASNLFYELDDAQTELQSYYDNDGNSGTFGNASVAQLLKSWQRLRGEWQAEPCVEVIDLGASAFAPDLIARRAGSAPVIYIEVLGFWTPRSLARRIKEFTRDNFKQWALVVSDEMRCSRDEAPAKLPPNVIICKAALDAARVETALNEVAT